jgi:hypothetical protein
MDALAIRPDRRGVHLDSLRDVDFDVYQIPQSAG